MRVLLPSGYPLNEPPVAVLEPGDAPIPGGVADALQEQWREAWSPGEVCVYQLSQLAEDALEGAQDEVRPIDGDTDSAAREQAGECTVPMPAGAAAAVGSSLVTVGFADCGFGTVFSHGLGMTVELRDTQELWMRVDGVDAEDLGDWAALQLEEAAHFGAQLLEWTRAQRSAEPGFLEDSGEAAEGDSLDFLPDPESLGVRRERELLIYTWGKALRKAAPNDSSFNFNAGVLNGRGGGANLRTMNGLSEEVQRNVASCGLFPRWLEMVTNKVEQSDLAIISINCTKGRHRSVAAAEILRSVYYPRATTRHLTIY